MEQLLVKQIVRLTMFLLLLSIGSATLAAQDTLRSLSTDTLMRQKSPTMYGARFGLVTGGGVHVERTTGGEWDTDLDVGLSAGAFLELPSTQWTTAAINAEFHQVRLDAMPAGFDGDRWMLDIGVMLKMALRRDSIGKAIRPVIGFSYGRVAGEDGIVSAANFMVLKGGVEGIYFFSRRTGLLFEALLVIAPYGRASAEGPDAIEDDANVRYDLSAGVRPLVRIGLVFK